MKKLTAVTFILMFVLLLSPVLTHAEDYDIFDDDWGEEDSLSNYNSLFGDDDDYDSPWEEDRHSRKDRVKTEHIGKSPYDYEYRSGRQKPATSEEVMQWQLSPK